jgi:small-conductance mechanosensitive channel
MTTLKRRILTSVVSALILVTMATAGLAQTAAQPRAENAVIEVPTAPVVIDGVTLFRVRGIQAFPADQRAAVIADRIVSIAKDPTIAPESITLVESEQYVQIMAGSTRIVAVIDADASIEGLRRSVLAEMYVNIIRQAIGRFRQDRNPAVLGRHAAWALGATVCFAVFLLVVRRAERRLRARAEQRYRDRVHDVQIKSFQVVRAERIWRTLIRIVNILWVVAALTATFVYLHFVLLLFPWTRGLGTDLASIVIVPLKVIGGGALAFVPNLVFLAVLVIVTRYLLKLIKLFFDGVAAGHVQIEKFEPEWALPTYRLVRLLVLGFAVVVAYPYIPGSQTEAFKGVSLFIGLVFSLGSSAFIGNMLAGYSMTYRRAFRVGDRVKIGEHVGEVAQVRLMVTHLRTPKNEEVIVPNSAILNQEVLNYSAMARKEGLILHTTVGIGYETPWRQVEAMLIEAARRTPGLLREPPPFVLQRGLGDFCVTYEINAYCDTPERMLQLYSALHQNILDLFNEYGVQIMTPAYEGDPEQPKVVAKSDWFLAPARPPAE